MLVGLLLAGCTSTVTGTASPADPAPTTTAPTESGAPTEPPADVTPPPPRGVGTVLESHRIAGATALIPPLFADRTDTCYPSGPFTGAADVEFGYFPEGTAAHVLDRWGFVAGWGQCGQTPDGGQVTLALAVELSDPDSAVRAAEELAAEQAVNGFEPAEVPGVDAPALLLADGGLDAVQVFVPVGRMLAYGYHEAPAGEGIEGAGRLMAEQVRLLQAFTPTPQAEVPALPADPLGLAPVTLDPPGAFDDWSGPYDLEGYLRLAIDPGRERELLSANGFRGFYTKQSQEGDQYFAVALYAFPSVTETNRVYEAFAELEAAAFGGTAFELPAIPEAPCFWFDAGDGTFYQRCYVGFRTYLASVDVGGLAAPNDVSRMNELLPAQRDLIDG